LGTSSLDPVRAPTRAPPSEFVNILGILAALLAVVGIGAAMSAVLPAPAPPWMLAASYGAPAAMAFTVYWWIAQRL
jgi:hypothetical protein